MKYNIILICFLSIILTGGAWKDIKLYKEYIVVKGKAIEAEEVGNTRMAISNFLKAAELAKNSNDNIQAHMLNRAAYCLIKKFIELNKNSKEIKNIELLYEAKEYLLQCQDLKVLEEVENIIQRNLSFCDYWIGVYENGK